MSTEGINGLLVVTTLPPRQETCLVAVSSAENVLFLISLDAPGFPLRRSCRITTAHESSYHPDEEDPPFAAGQLRTVCRVGDLLLVADRGLKGHGHTIWAIEHFLHSSVRNEVRVYSAVNPPLNNLVNPTAVAGWDAHSPIFFSGSLPSVELRKHSGGCFSGVCRADRDADGAWNFAGRVLNLSSALGGSSEARGLQVRALLTHQSVGYMRKLLVGVAYSGTLVTYASRILIFTGPDFDQLVASVRVSRGLFSSLELQTMAAYDRHAHSTGGVLLLDRSATVTRCKAYKVHGLFERNGTAKVRAQSVSLKCFDFILIGSDINQDGTLGSPRVETESATTPGSSSSHASYRQHTIAVYQSVEGSSFILTGAVLGRPVCTESLQWSGIITRWLVNNNVASSQPHTIRQGIDLCLPKAKRDPRLDTFDPSFGSLMHSSSIPLTPIPEEGEEEKSVGD